MAVIGELAVNIVARTDKLNKGVAKARKTVAAMSKGFRGATGAVSGFVGAATGIGGGIGILGIAANIRKAAIEIDALAKTSQKLGIATEQLAGLHVAAERTGVATTQLEMGLQRMTRRVSEAAQGTGVAVDALDELGLNARELVKLSPDQMFAKVAGAMKGVGSQADKVRLAFKLFDSEGVNLVRTLDLGASGLREMQMEAERLGLAVSKDQASQIEQFNDQVGRLKGLTGGLGRTILIRFAPGIMRALEGIENLIAPRREPKEFGRSAIIGKQPVDIFGEAGRSFANAFGRRFTPNWRDLQGPLPTERGVAIRPGELMSPEQSRKLLEVNTEQKSIAEDGNFKLDRMTRAIERLADESGAFGGITQPVTIPE